MTYTIETIDPVHRRIDIELPPDRYEPQVRARLQEIASKSRIKGFRPGKAPLTRIEREYRDPILKTILAELQPGLLREVIQKENLTTIDTPIFGDPISLPPQAGIRLTANVAVLPQIAVRLPEKLTLMKPAVTITDVDVAEWIERLRIKMARWEPAAPDHAAVPGDRLTLTYQCRFYPEMASSPTDHSAVVILGIQELWPTVQAALTGVKVGARIEIKVEFPYDHYYPLARGRRGIVQAHVQRLERPQLLPVDGNMMKCLGLESDNPRDLQVELRRVLEGEAAIAINRYRRQQFTDQLLPLNPLPAPTSLVNNAMASYREDYELAMADLGEARLLTATSMRYPELYEEEARARVVFDLLARQLARERGISMPPGRLHAAVERYSQEFERPDHVTQELYSQGDKLAAIDIEALIDEVLDWLERRSQVTVVPTTYNELMKSC